MSSKYYLQKKVLKKGSAGSTTLVESLIDGQPLVLKRILLKGNNQEEVMREAALLTALPPHPNVVSIKRWFIESDALVLVLEACHGDLSTLSITGDDDNILFNIAEQITRGLIHIHAHGIIHRDIKPRNLLYLYEKGEMIIKIADFGIAKKLVGTTVYAETAIGTPYYLSPEICKGEPYDYKTDLWALGCVLYELAAGNGQKAFTGLSIKALINAILQNEPKPLADPKMDKLVALLLQKDPQQRPTGEAFLQALLGSKRTFESEYKELCALVGKDRIDKFIKLLHTHNNTLSDFEAQIKGIANGTTSSSHVLTRIFALRKQASCSEADLDTILHIMRTFPNSQWESLVVKEFGESKHRLFLRNEVYRLSHELYELEQQIFKH